MHNDVRADSLRPCSALCFRVARSRAAQQRGPGLHIDISNAVCCCSLRSASTSTSQARGHRWRRDLTGCLRPPSQARSTDGPSTCCADSIASPPSSSLSAPAGMCCRKRARDAFRAGLSAAWSAGWRATATARVRLSHALHASLSASGGNAFPLSSRCTVSIATRRTHSSSSAAAQLPALMLAASGGGGASAAAAPAPR